MLVRTLNTNVLSTFYLRKKNLCLISECSVFRVTEVSTYRMSQAWQFTQPDTLAHELSDNVDGFLRHDSIELHQLVVAKSLHDLSLLQEGLWGHGSWLQSLHCYLGGAVPHAWHTDKTMLMQRTCRWRDILGKLTHQCYSIPLLSMTMVAYTVHVNTTYYIWRDIIFHTYRYCINIKKAHNKQAVTNTHPDACKLLWCYFGEHAWQVIE